MAVVLSHIGSPRKTTTTQKERIADRRNHMFSDDSGGGDFGDRTTAKGVADDVAASLSTENASGLFVEAILQLSWSSCHFRHVALGHVSWVRAPVPACALPLMSVFDMNGKSTQW
jgi:hypothetical protein